MNTKDSMPLEPDKEIYRKKRSAANPKDAETILF